MKIPAYIQLQFIVLMWGFTGVIGKLITLSSIPLVWGRTLIATVFLYIYLRFIVKENFIIKKKLILQFIGCGFVIGIHWVLFYGAIKISNISIATSTLSTGTLFAALLEPIFLKRKIKISEIFISIIIILCIFLIFKTEFQYWKGILMGVSCALLSALFSVINGKLHSKSNATVLTFYEMIGGFLILNLFIGFGNNLDQIIHIKFMDIFWLIILSCILTCLPMIHTIKLMKFLTPFTIMLSINLEPVYAILIAFLIWSDAEKMSLTFYIATAIMILAICTNGYLKNRTSQR
ncbi:DMT family transporter [Apibacter muscae]|uniref:DMT family transporter n=1 Tax=Apibacter muscae TaxID=2509004 RepID=UPI0011AD0D45|nr:DMT family transporter [Apibacter muscae]TWP22573.1 DMT family transporter [Apibacter muscae]